MLIAQITDSHIGSGKQALGNRARLECVVAAIADRDPDLVIVTGDLTDDGDDAAYVMLREMLRPLGARVLLTLGNHDRRGAYFRVFGDAPSHDGFVHGVDSGGPLRVVMLDTLDEGWQTAGFCADRATWLDACLGQEPDKPTLIALHHPPARCGVDWIDVNADGRWSERLEAIVRRHAQVVALTAGHVHQAIATQFAGRPLTVAPPTALPVFHDTRPIDPARPDGRRLIVAGAPGYAMHQWTGRQFITWFAVADEAPSVARFDASTQAMVRDIAAEAVTHND